jgi:multisubunit Na+/H+ antiporter MnhG subunit
MRDVAVTVLLFAGVAIEVLACLGALLMRDAFDRLHYVGATTPALLCIAAAVVVRDSFSLIGDKALALAAFVLVTSPVLVHLTARAIRDANGGERS